MKDQQTHLAEVRLGANLLHDFKQICTTDSEFVQGVKRDIAKIDAALQSNDLEQIISCNEEIFATYKIYLMQNAHLFAINRDVAQSRGLVANKITLEVMKQTLQNIIYQEKTQEVLQKVCKDGGLYALEKMSQYILDE